MRQKIDSIIRQRLTDLLHVVRIVSLRRGISCSGLR